PSAAPMDQGRRPAQPQATTAIRQHGIDGRHIDSVIFSETLNCSLGNIAKGRVWCSQPHPQRTVRVFADTLKPMDSFDLKMRGDGPVFQVNEFLRYYPEPACVVGKDFSRGASKHSRRYKLDAIEPVDIPGKR